MAKALFLNLALHGHINPTLPIVRELVRRGDDVAYYSTDAFAPDILQTGARYRAYGAAVQSRLDLHARPTDELAWHLMRTAAVVLETELEGFRSERPDYIISDSVTPWGQWAGVILGVPVVTSISTFAFNRRVLRYAGARGVRPASARAAFSKMRHVARAFLLGQRLRRKYRARGPGAIGSVMGHSSLNIVYTSRYFQPCAETFDERFHFIGPMTSRAQPGGFPWEDVRSPVIVYISLGTLFNANPDFFRACFAAFEREDLQVIMSIGPNVSKEDLGVPPSNVIVKNHVPQLEVLQRASVFVTHGGMNSVSESLAYGVPVVAVPQMGEQAIVGRRVEELGAGLYVAKDEATVDTLRGSVRQLLADGRFRRQAAVIRESFETAGGVGGGADAIVSFAHRA
jgi:MGT family glycosyltransferase